MSGFLNKSINQNDINTISTTTPTPNSIPRSLPDGTLNPNWTSIAETITVAKSGGQFTSVNDALDSITDASETKPYAILVNPGFYEEDPITMKCYVSLIGTGGISDTILKSKNNNSNFITCAEESSIEKFTIDGPSSENCSAFYSGNISIGASFIKDCIVDGYIGIWSNASEESIPLYVYDILINSVSDNITKLIYITNYGNISCFDCTSISDDSCGINIKYGIYISGPNTKSLINSFLFSGCPGSTGIYIDGGANVRINNSTLLTGETAIYIGPSGSSNVAIGSTTISAMLSQHFTDYNIKIDSPTANVSFYGKADKEKISVVAGATFTASFLDSFQDPDEAQSEPGQVNFGELWLGTKDSSIPLRSFGLHTYNTGIISGGGVSKGIGLHAHYESGLGYINNGLGVKKITWDAGDISVASDNKNYIFVNTDGYVDTSTFEQDYSNYILLGVVHANSSGVIFTSNHNIQIAQIGYKSSEYSEYVVGPISVSGTVAIIHNPPSLQIAVDGGTFYISNKKRLADAYAPITFNYWYRNGFGGWTQVLNQTSIDAVYYDNGTGTLAAVPAGTKYKKDLLYLTDSESGTEYHIVYGQELFDNSGLAEVGNNPVAPDVLSVYSLRVAGGVVLGNDTVITSLVDQRPKLGQLSSGLTAITKHSELSGLGVGNDHPQYQLRSEEGIANGYASLNASVKVPAAQLPLAILPPADIDKSVALVGTGTTLARQDHKHDISTASGITLDNTNDEGTATSLARSDHKHAHGNLIGGTLHAEASLSAAGFMSISDKQHFNGLDGAIQTIRKDLDGYQFQINGNSTTELSHYNFISGAIHSIKNDLDGYQTQISESYITELQHYNSISSAIQTIRKDCDGYQTQITGNNLTELQHYNAVSSAIQSIKKDLDGYAALVAPANVTKAAASTGSNISYARTDHKHDVTTAVPISVGTSNLEGTATSLARSDHQHKGTLLQTVFSQLSTDTTTSSATFVDLLTASITTGANYILIFVSFSSENTTKDTTNTFRITIDGIAANGAGSRFVTPSTPQSGSLVYKSSVSAAAHTIKLQWATSGGTAGVYAITNSGFEHASLLVQEVTV